MLVGVQNCVAHIRTGPSQVMGCSRMLVNRVKGAQNGSPPGPSDARHPPIVPVTSLFLQPAMVVTTMSRHTELKPRREREQWRYGAPVGNVTSRRTAVNLQVWDAPGGTGVL